LSRLRKDAALTTRDQFDQSISARHVANGRGEQLSIVVLSAIIGAIAILGIRKWCRRRWLMLWTGSPIVLLLVVIQSVIPDRTRNSSRSYSRSASRAGIALSAAFPATSNATRTASHRPKEPDVGRVGCKIACADPEGVHP